MKRLLGVDLSGSYSFNKTAKTITFSNLPTSITLGNILVINNATANTLIYNFADADIGAISFSNNVLTLDANTSAMNNTDELQIWLDVADDELIEAIKAMRFAINTLTKTIGMALPNAQGFPIMEVRQATAANMNVTASVSGTVTSNIGTGSLTNQTQMGGFAANDQIPALMHLQADNLRRNILVT
jgi:hypothetical protein